MTQELERRGIVFKCSIFAATGKYLGVAFGRGDFLRPGLGLSSSSRSVSGIIVGSSSGS